MINQRKLHINNQKAIFIGNFGRTVVHRHGAPVLLIGLSGKINVEVDGQKEQCNSVLIDANEPHVVDCQGETVATIYTELDTNTAHLLRQNYLSERPYVFDVTDANVHKKSSERQILAGNFDHVLNAELKNRFHSLDQRVEKCMQLLRHDREAELTQSCLARNLNISTSRLTHLFKEQMGISFRRYRLWAQLGIFTRDYLQTKDMTLSAQNSGFYDSAHLSNAYKKVFGISPSTVLNHLDEIVIG